MSIEDLASLLVANNESETIEVELLVSDDEKMAKYV